MIVLLHLVLLEKSQDAFLSGAKVFIQIKTMRCDCQGAHKLGFVPLKAAGAPRNLRLKLQFAIYESRSCQMNKCIKNNAVGLLGSIARK